MWLPKQLLARNKTLLKDVVAIVNKTFELNLDRDLYKLLNKYNKSCKILVLVNAEFSKTLQYPRYNDYCVYKQIGFTQLQQEHCEADKLYDHQDRTVCLCMCPCKRPSKTFVWSITLFPFHTELYFKLKILGLQPG